MQQFVFTVQFPQNRLQTITWLTVRVDSINSCLLSLTLHLWPWPEMSEWPYDLRWFTPYSTHLISSISVTPLDLTSLHLWLYFWPEIMYELLTLFDLKQTWHTVTSMNDLRQPLWLFLSWKIKKKVGLKYKKVLGSILQKNFWTWSHNLFSLVKLVKLIQIHLFQTIFISILSMWYCL